MRRQLRISWQDKPNPHGVRKFIIVMASIPLGYAVTDRRSQGAVCRTILIRREVHTRRRLARPIEIWASKTRCI